MLMVTSDTSSVFCIVTVSTEHSRPKNGRRCSAASNDPPRDSYPTLVVMKNASLRLRLIFRPAAGPKPTPLLNSQQTMLRSLVTKLPLCRLYVTPAYGPTRNGDVAGARMRSKSSEYVCARSALHEAMMIGSTHAA